MSKANLLIAYPAYGAMVSLEFHQSMINLVMLLNQSGYDCALFSVRNESLITRARNACVARFLADAALTHLLFIDVDIEFPPQAVLRLLNANKHIVGGVYPQKDIDVERL